MRKFEKLTVQEYMKNNIHGIIGDQDKEVYIRGVISCDGEKCGIDFSKEKGDAFIFVEQGSDLIYCQSCFENIEKENSVLVV